jgi:metal-responsive CopG/Arc/MetJ family transcriptional regulator
VKVSLPQELAAEIDQIADDRAAFVAEAVRRLLRDSSTRTSHDDIEIINAVAEDLNREAEDVLGYQALP